MNLIPRTNNFYVDDFFDDFLTSHENSMKCDIYEMDNKYHIELELPGFTKEEIKIEAKNNYLNITCEKSGKEENNDKKYLRRERIYSRYTRSFYLGDLDETKIEAEFNNGILKVVIPKEENKETKKVIEIK